MAPRETENNAYTKFGVTHKEHHGMLWYFLEWSRIRSCVQISVTFGRGKNFGLRNLADPPLNVTSLKWSSLITFDDFRDPPPPPTPMPSFSKQIEWSPFWILPKFSVIPLLGSQLRLIPPFVLSKIKWTPLKSSTLPPPPQVINNCGLVLKSLPPPSSVSNGSVPWLPIRSAKIVRQKPDCLVISTWPFRFRAMYFGHVSNIEQRIYKPLRYNIEIIFIKYYFTFENVDS